MQIFVFVSSVRWTAGCGSCQHIDAPTERGPLTIGPARRVAERPFIIVIGLCPPFLLMICESSQVICNFFISLSGEVASWKDVLDHYKEILVS